MKWCCLVNPMERLQYLLHQVLKKDCADNDTVFLYKCKNIL